MSAQNYYGYICPFCKTTVNVSTVVSTNPIAKQSPSCPNCRRDMVPNPKGTPVAANVYCEKCRTVYGMVTSDKCPRCQTPFRQHSPTPREES